ncbi:aminoglycoside 6-adenylyltransferase [Chloroflexota bacterium]
MQQENDVITKLQNWGRENDCVRAMILTSSRANPDSFTDKFFDYDITLYVSDIKSFMNDEWLSIFGQPMIKWPLKPMSTFSKDWITRLVIFENEIRIDFQITSNQLIEPSTHDNGFSYDNGFKVLADKDGLTESLNEPAYSVYNIKKPTEEEYESLINSFFWNATYVPKYLWRDELYFAKFMLDSDLRFNNLRKMIEWYIGLQHNWSVNTGLQGRFIKRYLNSKTWAELETTFSDADIENNWQAFFNMITLFRKLAVNVGNSLGYEYPHELDQKITKYCNKIKATKTSYTS